jgi:hypothetical protein
MTGLLVVRHDQNWVGFVIVFGVLIVLAALAYLDAWHADRRSHIFDPVLDAAIDQAVDLGNDVDHVDCSNPDCDETICHCRKPSECTGTTTLGCEHEGLCWDCRLGCRECRRDLAAEQDADWAAGR